MADLNLLIGAIGLLFLLVAFILNLLKKISQDSAIYNVLNIMGAGLLTYYAYVINSIPFLILEATWALFAVYKFIIISKKHFRY